MFLIFGTQGVKRIAKEEPVLGRMCPSCGSGDLEPKTYRNWFTLFFIPVFPISSGRLIYECNQCGSNFNEGIRDHVHEIVDNPSVVGADNSEISFYRALIASLVYLVKQGPSNTSKSLYEIEKMIFKIPNLQEELNSIKSSIINQGNAENQVFEYLYEAKDVMDRNQLWELFIQIGEFVKRLESITPQQENLIKEYLIASGFPKSKYSEIVNSY